MTKPMFDVDQTVKDLVKTIDLMRNTGWLQGKNFDRSGNCCAWGAVILATNETSGLDLQLERASNIGRAFYRVVGTDLVGYNDLEGRTKDQVIRALETTLNALKTDPSVLTARKEDKP